MLQYEGRQVGRGRRSGRMQGGQEWGAKRPWAQEVSLMSVPAPTARIPPRLKQEVYHDRIPAPASLGISVSGGRASPLPPKLWLDPPFLAGSSTSSKPTLYPPAYHLPGSPDELVNAEIGTHPHPIRSGWEAKHPPQLSTGKGWHGTTSLSELNSGSRAIACQSATSASVTNT